MTQIEAFGFTFREINNGTAYELVRYAGSDTRLKIPPAYNGKPILRIASYAFAGCSQITDLVISEGIVEIGEGAFHNCTSLVNLQIPNSVPNKEQILGSRDTNTTEHSSVSSVQTPSVMKKEPQTSTTAPDPKPWWRKHWKALCAGGLLGVILIVILCVVLMPGTGSLYISSTPSGASVYIDDNYKGTTPGTFEVTNGKHTVALKLSGYETYSTTVNVDKGKERSLSPTLSSTGGTIKVTSSPSGASIYVDGEYMGTTPKTLTLEPKKSSQYRVVVMKSGYNAPASKLYKVTKGSSQNAEFTLSSSKKNTDVAMVDSTVPDDNGYTTVTYRIANYNSYPVSIKYESYTHYSGSEKHLYDTTFTVTLPANSATTKTLYNVYWPRDSLESGTWWTTKIDTEPTPTTPTASPTVKATPVPTQVPTGSVEITAVGGSQVKVFATSELGGSQSGVTPCILSGFPAGKVRISAVPVNSAKYIMDQTSQTVTIPAGGMTYAVFSVKKIF